MPEKSRKQNTEVLECHVKDFPAGTKLYVRRSFAGFYSDYLCSFISYENGMVRAKVLVDGYHARRGTESLNYKAGTKINARPSKCHFYNNGVVWIKHGFPDINKTIRKECSRCADPRYKKRNNKIFAKINDIVWKDKAFYYISTPRYKVAWIAPKPNQSNNPSRSPGKHKCMLYNIDHEYYLIGTLENLLVGISAPQSEETKCLNIECEHFVFQHHVCGLSNDPADIQDCNKRISE